MIIPQSGRETVPDISNWVEHFDPVQVEDGGCPSVVIGWYRKKDSTGKYVLDPRCRQQCIDLVTKTDMILQIYFWDDIIISPYEQANWLADTLVSEGLPVKFTWADQEQYWISWGDKSIVASPTNINIHNKAFMDTAKARINNLGLYTAKWFVDGWAPSMNSWLPNYYGWLAHYGVAVPTKVMSWETLKASWLPGYDPLHPSGMADEHIMGHQFTDRPLLPCSYNRYYWIPGWPNGGRQQCDVTVFRSTFLDAIRAGTLEPAHMPTQNLFYVNIGLVNVRSSASDATTSNIIGQMSQNTRVDVDTYSGSWSHFKPMAGWNDGGWIWTKYLTKV